MRRSSFSKATLERRVVDWSASNSTRALKTHRIALVVDGPALAGAVLDPGLDDAGAAPSPDAARLAASVRLATEVQLEVAVGDLVGLAQRDHLAALEQHRAVAEAVDRAHVVGDEHDRPARIAHLG